MRIEEFEKCFNEDFRKWFSDWAMITYLDKGEMCLKEIYDIWIKSNREAKYFWITQTGRISHADRTAHMVPTGSIRLKDEAISLYRNSQIDKVLN